MISTQVCSYLRFSFQYLGHMVVKCFYTVSLGCWPHPTKHVSMKLLFEILREFVYLYWRQNPKNILQFYLLITFIVKMKFSKVVIMKESYILICIRRSKDQIATTPSLLLKDQEANGAQAISEQRGLLKCFHRTVSSILILCLPRQVHLTYEGQHSPSEKIGLLLLFFNLLFQVRVFFNLLLPPFTFVRHTSYPDNESCDGARLQVHT